MEDGEKGRNQKENLGLMQLSKEEGCMVVHRKSFRRGASETPWPRQNAGQGGCPELQAVLGWISDERKDGARDGLFFFLFCLLLFHCRAEDSLPRGGSTVAHSPPPPSWALFTHRLDSVNVVRLLNAAAARGVVLLQNAAQLLQPHLHTVEGQKVSPLPRGRAHSATSATPPAACALPHSTLGA